MTMDLLLTMLNCNEIPLLFQFPINLSFSLKCILNGKRRDILCKIKKSNPLAKGKTHLSLLLKKNWTLESPFFVINENLFINSQGKLANIYCKTNLLTTSFLMPLLLTDYGVDLLKQLILKRVARAFKFSSSFLEVTFKTTTFWH